MTGASMTKAPEEMNKRFRARCEAKGLEDGNKSLVFGRARTADHVKSTRGWVGWVESAEQKGSDQLAVCSGVVALLPDAVFRKVETEILRCDELIELLGRE
ncbi:uncharacterized protein PODANS_6_1045 [Podospora anserina S mat+]|uniref:Podospora anserina S mat+ genomic DNA chromosome 6, supercontig 2 n=1 Tax=Podospora anserina (strain S / ATCC MYA-4624 / DSM 980 / FGSC 10383) TaxID=515849 RepID=B2B352_PODAN|nr:uncharacterized protein PODANS_6_1045 [Podospora anserina S mat+]CAP71538.1 unnamed protein product [Podospora anserina S mat+]CDP30934.1 Putative protein of unknown function [Podospora anserina S mat+]